MTDTHTSPLLFTLESIRLIHTVIWVLMAASVFYVFYSGVSGNISTMSWVSVWMIILEGFALVVGKGDCPLHVYALRITGKKHLNDTYLPEFVFFKGYKTILSIIYFVGLVMMLVR